MAKLTPDKVVYAEGLKINQKLIPDGTVWNKNVYDSKGNVKYKKGSKYKAEKPIKKIEYTTIHNPGNGDAETFARATWNQNMNDSRVHYYVDDKEAWQLLRDDEVGWHAGDGSGPGNSTSLSIEICMGSMVKDPKKAEENGALLAAIKMKEYNLPIERVVPHKYWKRSNGTYKECPIQILPHWGTFIETVKKKYAEITGKGEDTKMIEYTVQKGDALYKIAQKHGLTTYELIKANPQLKNPDLLRVDDVIYIPVKQQSEPDYNAMYEEEKARADAAEAKIRQLEAEGQLLKSKILSASEILKL